jgi:hypothetical protein
VLELSTTSAFICSSLAQQSIGVAMHTPSQGPLWQIERAASGDIHGQLDEA